MNKIAKKLLATPLYEGHGEESDLPEDAAEEIERLESLVEELKADRIRINDEAETEIARLRSENEKLREALAVANEMTGGWFHDNNFVNGISAARKQGYQAGRQAGLEEAEIKIANMNAEASSAWVNPTLADQAYLEGRAECVKIIRALKEKQP